MDNPAFVLELDGELEKSKNGVKPSEKVYSFEEAIALTGTGKFHYFLLLVSGFCFMAVMVETMGVSIIMPFMKCDLESTIAEQGILASAGFLGIVLSSHAMGFLADTWGRLKTLRAALVSSFITTVISAFSVNIWMLIVFRFLNGFFISGCQACVFSYVGEFHGRNTRVKYVTLLSMFMPVGLMILPSLAIAILPLQLDTIVLGLRFNSWRVLLLTNSIFSLTALCGLLLTPESPKYVLIQGKHDRALEILRMLFRWNTSRPGTEYPAMKVHVEISGASLSSIHGVKDAFMLVWNQTVPLFYRERIFHTINICCLMFVIYGIGQGTFMWFPTMLDQLVAKSGQGYLVCETMYMLVADGTNGTKSADQCNGTVNTGMFEVLAMIGAGFTIIYLIFAFTIDIIGKKNLLMAWLFIAAVSCLAIHWVSSFVLSVILLTLTMAIGNCGGIVSTISVEYFPTNISAMGMCLIMMIGRLGAVAGSNFVGLSIFSSCDLLFYIYVGIVCVVAFFGYLLPDKGRKTKKDTIKPAIALENNLSQGIKQQTEA